MIRNTSYRLAEYKIVESEHGDLWWETHFGFGSLKFGKCFIRGNILFIEFSNSDEPGFLKGEFLDHIYKLPKWGKTKYYCSNYTILECKSGRRPSQEEKDGRSSDRTVMAVNRIFPEVLPKMRNNAEQSDTTEDSSYKLDKYEIVEKNNGQVWWESYSGRSSAKVGKCFIQANILFIGPSKIGKTAFSKKEFMERLIQLPEWGKTKYYCPRYTIYNCKTGIISRDLGVSEDLGKKANNRNNIGSKKTFDERTIPKPIEFETKLITKVKEKAIGTWVLFKNWLGRRSH